MSHATATGTEPDRGVVDVSIEMLVGLLAVIAVLLLLFETAAFWHARNVFDDAASDGVRVAAAYDGSCAAGIEAARASVARAAGGWADSIDIACTDGAVVTVSITGRTPGVLSGSLGFDAHVSQSAPRER